MALINIVNDCLIELGKQDVENCKQRIVCEAQNEIFAIQNNPYLSDEEKFYKTNRISQISNELLLFQDRRKFLLDAAGFLNEISKMCEKK